MTKVNKSTRAFEYAVQSRMTLPCRFMFEGTLIRFPPEYGRNHGYSWAPAVGI